MPFLKHWSPDSGLSDAHKADPRIYTALFALHEAIMRGRSSLSVPQRELIAAFVSGVNRCTFCTGEHVGFAARAGITAEVVRQLVADVESARVQPKLKPLLRFARKLTLEPDRVVQSDVDAIFAAGWNEKAYRDIVAITALMNLANRLAAGFGIEIARNKGHHGAARGNLNQR
jgi:uncharacterized peroxidase-related enzyme